MARPVKTAPAATTLKGVNKTGRHHPLAYPSLAILGALLLAPLLSPAAAQAGGRGALATAPPAAPPQVEAEVAALVDVASRRVLWAKNPDRPLAPASTAKILTALVALERTPLNAPVKVSQRAAEAEGSSVYLRPGMTVPMKDLLYGLMLASGNDAARAIAEHVAGSEAGFARLMNETARRLGASRSHFVNPNGLPAEGQVTTARDLAIITAHALRNPTFATIVATERRTLLLPGGERRELYNHNRILGLEGIDGVKTGYTVKARHTFVASATREGWQLVAVVLGDTKQGKWTDARALLHWGFETYESVPLARRGEGLGAVSVRGGRATDVPVTLDPSGPPLAVALKGDGSESAYYRLEVPTAISAPVQRGQPLGRARIFVNGQSLDPMPLVAARAVAAAPGLRGLPHDRPGAAADANAGFWGAFARLLSRLVTVLAGLP